MRRENISTGNRYEAQVGYSRLVKVGRQIYLSGTTALLPSGEFIGEGDAFAQTVQIFKTIESSLAQVRSSLSDVVRTRIFVTDIAAHADAVARGHKQALAETNPATAMVQVARLIDPRMVVEIEVDAIKGSGEVVSGARPRIVEASFEVNSDLAKMLASVDLPVPAEAEHVNMLKAYVGGDLVGCVGFERYGRSALLRSLVVISQAKGYGVGRALVTRALEKLREEGVTEVVLVTADTAQYFGYLGFVPVERGEVNTDLARSPEFSAYEQDQVTYMRYRIPDAG